MELRNLLWTNRYYYRRMKLSTWIFVAIYCLPVSIIFSSTDTLTKQLLSQQQLKPTHKQLILKFLVLFPSASHLPKCNKKNIKAMSKTCYVDHEDIRTTSMTLIRPCCYCCFLFHLKTFYRFQDTYFFALTFRSYRKNSLIRKIRLILRLMVPQPG